MNDLDLDKLYQETNQKFVQRIEGMLYFTCGCDFKRGKIVLEECLRRNKDKSTKEVKHNERE